MNLVNSMNPSDPTNLINPSNRPSEVNKMKKLFRIAILAILFFILNPIGLISVINETNEIDQIDQTNQINEINETNQIDQINKTNQIDEINQSNETNDINPMNPTNRHAYAQSSKRQPTAGPVHPAPTISKHPSQILLIDIPENYIIGKGDVLRVFVWRNEQLSSEVVVRPDGKISLPLLQDLQADGLTAPQLKEEITRKFSEYINNPKVTVIVNQINSCKVSVLGKVTSPGLYPITGNTTFIEAISMAGGFTEWANKRKITVITHQGGKKKKIMLNYKKIISGKNPSQNIILKRGDTIIVP